MATILWPTILGLMITLIMIFLFVPDRLPAADDECRDVLKHPDDWGQACDHPSHRIDVQSDLVVCRCPERP